MSSPSQSSTTYLVRLGPPGKGDTIHRSTCTYARKPNALRWVWADRQGFENIDWDALRRHGLKPCGRCAPELLRADGKPPDLMAALVESLKA